MLYLYKIKYNQTNEVKYFLVSISDKDYKFKLADIIDNIANNATILDEQVITDIEQLIQEKFLGAIHIELVVNDSVKQSLTKSFK